MSEIGRHYAVSKSWPHLHRTGVSIRLDLALGSYWLLAREALLFSTLIALFITRGWEAHQHDASHHLNLICLLRAESCPQPDLLLVYEITVDRTNVEMEWEP